VTGTIASTRLFYEEKFVIKGDREAYLKIKPELEKYLWTVDN
jgi:hypothetical protein